MAPCTCKAYLLIPSQHRQVLLSQEGAHLRSPGWRDHFPLFRPLPAKPWQPVPLPQAGQGRGVGELRNEHLGQVAGKYSQEGLQRMVAHATSRPQPNVRSPTLVSIRIIRKAYSNADSWVPTPEMMTQDVWGGVEILHFYQAPG